MAVSLWDADLHVHTNLSFCAPRTTKPEDYIPYAEKEGIKLIGFSNHLYYNERIKNSGLGFDTGADYGASLRPELEKLSTETGVKLLLGCEVETVYGREPSLSYEDAGKFDYILLAASHIMNLPDLYRGVDVSTKEKISALTVERFRYACNLEYPVPCGICHPLYPICTGEWEQEIVDGFSDSLLSDLFSLAAKKNKSIEIHVCLLRDGTKKDKDGISPSYVRLLRAAKAEGCRFHFGSDAHEVRRFEGTHALLCLAAEKAGIGESDMWTFDALK